MICKTVLSKLKDSLEARVVNMQMKADTASKLEKENKKLTEREEENLRDIETLQKNVEQLNGQNSVLQ